MCTPRAEEVRLSAERLYGRGQPVWDPLDRWNSRKVREIDRFCRTFVRSLPIEGLRVLNAGSGSHNYDWIPSQAIWLDRFAAQLERRPGSVAADIQRLPFAGASFDLVICVGSVLNYVSALEALAELVRVLDCGGWLLLHFETSDSLEHIFTPTWRAPAAPIKTMNNGKPDVIWVYSQRFVRTALHRLRMRIAKVQGFHVCSAALLRVGLPQQIAATAQALDALVRPLHHLADDVILAARKGGRPDGETFG